MRHLCVNIDANAGSKHDGDEFHREAEAFAGHALAASGRVMVVHMPTKGRSARDGLLVALRRYDGAFAGERLDVLNIFDHGTSKALPRFGITCGNIDLLADAIAAAADSHIVINLCACSTGRGHYWMGQRRGRAKRLTKDQTNENDCICLASKVDHREGFAMLLAKKLLDRDVTSTIFAHLTAAHTTRNPHVVRIRGIREGAVAAQVCRNRVMYPAERVSWRAWCNDMQGPYRFEFWRDYI